MLQFQFYGLLLVLSVLVSIVTGTMAWRRRRQTPAAAALAMVMLSIVLWAGAEAIGHLFTDVGIRTAFALAAFIGVSLLVPSFYWLCRVMVDPSAWLSRRVKLLLAIEPVFVLIAASTNAWHRGLLSSTRLTDGGLLMIKGGPLFWVHSVYCYLLLGWAVYGVARAWRTASLLQRRQLRTVMLGAVFPAVPNLLALAGADSGGAVDFSAIAFLATGLVNAWAIFNQGMLSLVPVARAVVLDRVTDAVFVIGPDGEIMDHNPAAVRLGRRLWPDLPSRLLGTSLWDLPRMGRFAAAPPPDGEHTIRLPGGELDLDLRSTPLADRHRNLLCHAFVVRDVSELTARKRQLAAVNDRLHEQLVMIDRLRADLAEQAARDALTGLHNRRHLDRMMRDEVARATAAGDHLGVVLLDIDHFKAVNDRYGHAAGDEMLVAMARMLQRHARAGDTVARYGGEEFVVLLPGATMEQAWDRAEEWRRDCRTVMVDGRAGAAHVTFSAGVATYPECGSDPDGLLRAADDALYAAKAAGRDRVLAARAGA